MPMSQLKAVVNGLVGTGVRELRKVLPEQFSPDKKFINAMSGGLALMVMADGVVEEEETVSAVEFLMTMPCVMELSMQAEAAEMYEKHIEELESAYNKSPVDFVVKKAEVVGEISMIKEMEASFKGHLLDMLNLVTSGGGADPSEVQMKDQIKAALA